MFAGSRRITILFGLACTLSLGETNARAGDFLALGESDLGAWSVRRLNGWTEYSVDRSAGIPAVRAETMGGAAAMVLKRRIALVEHPVLTWSWKTKRHYRDLDERRLAQLDFPLRISASVSRGFGYWNAHTLSYVVASNRPVGEVYRHPDNEKTVIVVIANRGAAPGAWHRQRVNLREDFGRYLGLDVNHVDALSILVDNDSAGQDTTTWVRGLSLSVP